MKPLNLADIQDNECFHKIFGISCERNAKMIESASVFLGAYFQKGNPTKRGCIEAILSAALTEEERVCILHVFSPLVHKFSEVTNEDLAKARAEVIKVGDQMQPHQAN